MASDDPLIFVVDDDASVRAGLDSLFRSVGYRVQSFASAQAFLSTARPAGPCCLVLDVRMPGASGMDLQSDLAQRGEGLPIVFLTGHGDVPMCASAMRAGAVDFLLKPFREQDLLNAVRAGIEKDRLDRAAATDVETLKARYETLTRREREVMGFVVRGFINRDIAAKLRLSEISIKVNRGQAMRKMEAQSLADLVRMADKLGDDETNRPGGP